MGQTKIIGNIPMTLLEAKRALKEDLEDNPLTKLVEFRKGGIQYLNDFYDLEEPIPADKVEIVLVEDTPTRIYINIESIDAGAEFY